MRDSPNLRAEIKELHWSAQNSSIEFQNGSKIFAVPYGENALGKHTFMFQTYYMIKSSGGKYNE